MRHRFCLVETLFGLGLLTSVAFGREPIRIDDTTVFDPIGGRTYTALLPEAPDPLPGGPGLRSLTDGFAGCSTSDNCAPFDLVTYSPGVALSLLPEGNYPYDATLNPAADELWIPGASGDGVIVVDRATNVITHRIPVGEYPVSVAFSNDGSLALVACRDTEEITLVDTATHTATGSLPIPTTYLGAGNIALDPVSGNFYMVDWYGDDLYEIAPDGSAVLNQVTLGSSLWQLVVNPDGQHLYVTDRGTDEVRVIERTTLTQVAAFHVGDDPWGIDITASGDRLVVACEDSHDAYVIDLPAGPATPIALDAAADPRDVDILDESQKAFVAGGRTTTGNPVYVINVSDGTLETSFEAAGTNVNVIAVQGQMHESATGAGELATVPRTTLVAGPNPFVPETHVRYSLEREAFVRLSVHDVSGRLVRVLSERWQGAGSYAKTWEGRNAAGVRVTDGAYFVRLQAGDATRTTKVVVRSGN